MNESMARQIPESPRQMLRSGFAPRSPVSGDDVRREIGQAFEWALDRARITKKQAADAMGYSDQAILGRWVSGLERVQLDKCKLLGDEFFREFVIALAQTCAGVSVTTQINLQRTA